MILDDDIYKLQEKLNDMAVSAGSCYKDSSRGRTMRLQPTSQRARNKNRGVFSGVCGRALCSRLKRRVKRTQTAAPPHHAVAPDSAEGRSQVNRVVLLRLNRVVQLILPYISNENLAL